MPSKRHRTPLQIARDKKIIASMYLQGYKQSEIAAHIDRNQSTVSRDLRGIQAIWERSSLVDFDTLKRIELDRIDAIEITYWQAWRDSGGEIVSTTVERVASDQGKEGTKRAKEVIKTEDSVGDFAALRGVQWCINKRCEILGLDAPVVVDLSWQQEIIDLLMDGAIEPAQVSADFGPSLANHFFEQAGIELSALPGEDGNE